MITSIKKNQNQGCEMKKWKKRWFNAQIQDQDKRRKITLSWNLRT